MGKVSADATEEMMIGFTSSDGNEIWVCGADQSPQCHARAMVHYWQTKNVVSSARK
jgi:hypothetical protein